MLSLTTPNFSLLALLVTLVSVVEGSATPHLREILLGRCYFASPAEVGASRCPQLVDSFVDILTSHTDATIQASDFSAFLQQLDFSASAGKDPLLWLGETSGPQYPLPPNIVSPQTTPGGSLMKDLVFCGSQDEQDDCTMESSRAYWKFWHAATLEFLQSLDVVVDHLTIVVEPTPQLWERSMAPVAVRNLIPSSDITKVTIYETEGDCSADNVRKLMNDLQAEQMPPVSCRENIWELWDHPLVDAREQHGRGEPNTTQMETLVLLLTYMTLVIAFYYCATDGIDHWKKMQFRSVDQRAGEWSPLLCKKQKAIYDGNAIDDDEETCAASSVGSIGDTDLVGSKEPFEME